MSPVTSSARSTLAMWAPGDERLEPGRGDRGGERPLVLGRRRLVVRAAHDERRRRDRGQRGAQVHALDRAAARRVALRIGGEQHRPQPRLRLGMGVANAGGEPALDDRVRDDLGRPRGPHLAARSAHADAGGMCADVQQSTSRSTRSGAFAPSHIATIPPSETPPNEARSTPSRSISARTSRPRSSIS